MIITRRGFLGQIGAAGIVGIGCTPPSFLCRAALAKGSEGKAERDGRVLVILQLAGGNDGLNTVIPHGDDAYYKARPGIAIPKGAVLQLDKRLGLHPAMTGFKELHDEGSLAILQGVGYANPDRSHFRSMDIWHTARPEVVNTEDGWLGRALDATLDRHAGTLPALALGMERLPLALVSAKVNVPTVGDLAGYQLHLGAGPEPARKLRRELIDQLTAGADAHGSDLDFIRKTARTAYTSAEKLKNVMASYKPAADYPATGLAQKLKMVAQVLATDLGTRVFFLSLDGFDTHAQQSAAHFGLLAELAGAVRAFFKDLKGHKLDDRVMLATFSEFGRRVKENGSLGTDHGAASQMFVVSPRVKAGIHGKHPSLTDLGEGDLKFHTDFRSVYATLLEKWLGFPSDPVLGKKFPTLNIV